MSCPRRHGRYISSSCTYKRANMHRVNRTSCGAFHAVDNEHRHDASRYRRGGKRERSRCCETFSAWTAAYV